MTVAFVMALVLYTSVVVTTFLKETVTVTETNLMSVVFVAVTGLLKELVTVMATCQPTVTTVMAIV